MGQRHGESPSQPYSRGYEGTWVRAAQDWTTTIVGPSFPFGVVDRDISSSLTFKVPVIAAGALTFGSICGYLK